MNKRYPNDVVSVAQAFADGVADILGSKLYGIYMYGASVFDDAGPIQDIDCHVILTERLAGTERDALRELFGKLAESYPPLGGEVDAYFILLDDAKGTTPPQNQLKNVFDDSWALHCAHVRAGRYETLLGPEPTEVFPAPTWRDIVTALDHELSYVKEHLCYPAYCILNLCRIALSYSERDPVKSKWGSGLWATERFPEWEPLIQAALRSYAKEDCDVQPKDHRLLKEQMGDFLACAEEYIGGVRDR